MPKYRYNVTMSSALGQRLKDLRTIRNLTQGQLAEYAHISQSSLSDIERGEIAPKTIDVIVNLANYFEVSTDYLLGVTDTPRRVNPAELSATLQEIIIIGKQLPPARQADLLRIAEAFNEQDEPGSLTRDARDKALGRKPDVPRIIGGEE
jgi:transcriptional regulator with XRE-family HTH domain